VGENAKASTRLYGWGSAVHGALGEPLFLERKRLRPTAEPFSTMDHPARIRFGDMNKVNMKKGKKEPLLFVGD
jgi:hypothetical protein